MKRGTFKQKSYDEIIAKKREAVERAVAKKKEQTSQQSHRPAKRLKTAKTASKRAKKMQMKKELCEQYGLPNIPCSRWGIAKTFTRQDLLKGMLWTVFSKYIRQRDQDKPCVACGIMVEVKQAGHYIPVGGNNIELCFLPENVHGECPTCNADFNGWHLVPMRKNMVAKYGEAFVEELDRMAGMKTTVKWTEEDFVTRIKMYL